MASSDVRKDMHCSICLNIYFDPVTLKCGHNFCRDCIERVLDTQGRSGLYLCPECREEFHERPELPRNITLCNIVKNFLSTEPKQKEMEIFCTYCIHSPVPAVKSCLLCEASLCDDHLKLHSKSPQHVLSDLTNPLESRKCPVHKKILEYYCSKEATCLCGSCRLHGNHQKHELETLKEASEKRKENLTKTLQNLLKKREEMEQGIERLKEYKTKLQDSASGVTKRVTTLFRDIRRQLDTLERKILNEISRQAEKDSFPASYLIQDLEIKQNELSRKVRDIEKICKMTDPLSVLQESDNGDLYDSEDGDDEDRKRYHKLLRGGGEMDVAEISRTLHTGLSDIIGGVNRGIHIPEPADILLDANRAEQTILILDDRKTARRLDSFSPVTLKTFKAGNDPQVLSSQSFSSGRHYWDVDVGGSLYWRVGVCYFKTEMVSYTTRRIYFPWWLERSSTQLSVKFDNKSINLSGNFYITRVRIFLDYEAGQISFYELGVPIQHLHTFTKASIKGLQAAFCVGEGCIKICRGNQEV